MTIMRNIANRTDCIFHEYNGLIEEKEDYWVIRTPSNPSFRFGNLLIFKEAPSLESYSNWMEVHRKEFGETLPHVTFSWDTEEQGEVEAFRKCGFKVVNDLMLRMDAYHSVARINPEFEVRKIIEDWEWEAVTDLGVRVSQEDFNEGGDVREFCERQNLAFRRMSEAKRGDWWGAFSGDTLVCTMGLFFDKLCEVGRFQNVSTLKEHRRKGACSSLLDHVSRNAFEVLGVKELIINTGDEDDNPARSVYCSVGYVECMKGFSLSLHDRLAG